MGARLMGHSQTGGADTSGMEFGMKIKGTCGVLSCLVLMASTVHAAERNIDSIYHEDSGVWLSSGATYMDYAETSSGATLDSETGSIPEVQMGTGVLIPDRAPPLLRNLYLRFDGAYKSGGTAYNGALQNIVTGATTPYSTTTDDTVWSASGRVGRGLPLGNLAGHSGMLIPFAELGYRHWDRNLTGPYGYDEVYQNWDFMGGVLLQLAVTPKWIVSVNGAIGSTFSARMDTGGVKFPLGDALTWRGGGQVSYNFARHLEVFGAIDVSRLGFGASPAEYTNQRYYAYEPTSTTYESSFRMGVAYHL